MTHKEHSLAYYHANRERMLASRKKDANPVWYARSRDKRRLWEAKLRFAMITAYGSTCACCGELEPAFLTLDHIGGGGAKHRAEKGQSTGTYLDLRKRGWPKDKYQLLCMNCNWVTRLGAPCPHVEKRANETALAFTAYEDNRDG